MSPTTVTAVVQEEKPASQQKAVTYQNMFRLYNPNSGEHFYTANLDEAKKVVAAGWQWEGIGWVAPDTSKAPVYRLYSGTDHHYTANKDERDHLVSVGWKYEGIGWYSDDDQGVALFRQFNPNVNPSAKRNNSGSHNYTASKAENDKLVSLGWRAEGIGWYGANHAMLPFQGFWTVTAAWGNGLQRYWIDATAQVAKGRYVDPSNAKDAGCGYLAYATPTTGAVVRGAWKIDDSHVIVADNDGRTVSASTNGWKVTSEYAGELHRYYYENGRARIGSFSVDGVDYFGVERTGYVLTNGSVKSNGKWYWADADGKLAYLPTGKIGYQNPSWMYQVSANNAKLPSYARGKFAYLTASTIRPEYTRSQVVEAFIACAKGYLGTPYRWDYALAPGVGVDCSGLVMQCMQAVGIQSVYNSYDHMYDPWQDHDAANMRNDSKIQKISVSSARRGDLLFYTGHVAIYLGSGKIIESTNWEVEFDGVQISDAFARTPIAAGRLFS